MEISMLLFVILLFVAIVAGMIIMALFAVDSWEKGKKVGEKRGFEEGIEQMKKIYRQERKH